MFLKSIHITALNWIWSIVQFMQFSFVRAIEVTRPIIGLYYDHFVDHCNQFVS